MRHDDACAVQHPSEPRHSLLVFDDGPRGLDFGKVLDGIADRQVCILRLAPDAAHHVRGRCHMHDPGRVLIRPDQVIAARGDNSDLTTLDTYLDPVVRPAAT